MIMTMMMRIHFGNWNDVESILQRTHRMSFAVTQNLTPARGAGPAHGWSVWILKPGGESQCIIVIVNTTTYHLPVYTLT